MKSNLLFGTIIGALMMLLDGLLLFGPTGRDDVYKTLWPAHTFATSGQILNYNGEALEQSSSLLHVLLLGGLHRLTGINLPDLNFLLIFACGLLSIALLLRLGKMRGIVDLFSLGLLAGAQAIFTYWALGGLDSVLAAVAWLLFAAGLARFLENRSPWEMLIGVAMVVTVRPEGGFVAIATLGVLLLHNMIFWRKKGNPQPSIAMETKKLIWVSISILMLSGLVVVWRLWHSGDWLPQPAIAKSGGFGWTKSIDGLRYLYQTTRSHPEMLFLWVGLLLAFFRTIRRQASPLETIVLAIVGAGIAFVVVSGGDWMENGRFLVPFVPLMLLNAVFRLETMKRKWVSILKVAWIGLCLIGLMSTARWHNTGYAPVTGREPGRGMRDSHEMVGIPFTERYNRVHLRDVAPLRALKLEVDGGFARKGRPVTVLSQQAGMMAFHLAETHFRKFQFIDLVGLCTSDFTDCAMTRDRGNFRGGLNMDLVYFFEDLPNIQAKCGIAAPDIVFGLDDAEGSLRNAVLANGYRDAYLQGGKMPIGKGWFPGMEIDAIEFIAVRDLNAVDSVE